MRNMKAEVRILPDGKVKVWYTYLDGNVLTIEHAKAVPLEDLERTADALCRKDFITKNHQGEK